MAYDIKRLEKALVNADKAGDAVAAKAFADKIREMRSAEKPTEKYDPYTAENIVGSAVEPLMTLGTGAVGAVAGGLSGLGALGAESLGYDVDPAQVVQDVSGALTYEPITEGGQIATEAITYPFQKLAEGAKYLGEGTMEATGSPGLATAVETGVQSLPILFGAKGARKGMPPEAQPTFPRLESALKSPLTGVQKVSSAIGRGGKHLTEPWLPGGAERVAGRAATEIAGTRSPAVIKALQEARAGETAGQAAQKAGSFEFSALQDLAKSKKPSEYGDISRRQQMERKTALQENIGRTKEDLSSAVETRKQATDPLYEAARKSPEPINTSPVIQQIDEIIAKNPGNPPLLTEMNKLKKGLTRKEKGVVTPRTSPQEVASSIEGLKTALANKDNAFIVKELTGIKNQLTDSMPLYKAADAKYAELSEPINQMKIGQKLEKSLDPRLGAEERAASYSTTLEKLNETTKDVTGRKVPVEEALTESQLQVVNAIKGQLDKDAILKSQATKGRSAMKEKLGTALEMPTPPGILERGIVIAKSIIERMRGEASKKSLDIIAKEMQDPKKMAELMKNATPKERVVLQAFLDAKNPAIIGGAISEAEKR